MLCQVEGKALLTCIWSIAVVLNTFAWVFYSTSVVVFYLFRFWSTRLTVSIIDECEGPNRAAVTFRESKSAAFLLFRLVSVGFSIAI